MKTGWIIVKVHKICNSSNNSNNGNNKNNNRHKEVYMLVNCRRGGW